jgi:hypothetical protein
MRVVKLCGSHTGHTLVGAGLDCHYAVVIDNKYGGAIPVDTLMSSVVHHDKWDAPPGFKYSFSHPMQRELKGEVVWVGNTGGIVGDIDLHINVVKNPYEVAYTFLKKYKTTNRAFQSLDTMFSDMQSNPGPVVYYEDLIAYPEMEFLKLAATMELEATARWLAACASLIKEVERPRLDVDLDFLFDRYDFLRRYK